MQLETLIEVWSKEAIAHDYIGFLIYTDSYGYGRTFLTSKDNINEENAKLNARGFYPFKKVFI